MIGHMFGNFVLVVSASFCLFTTWSSFTAPEEFARQLGFGLLNAGGHNEIRAQYAGFFLAVACVCMAAVAGLVARQVGFVALVMVFCGLFAGRIVSLVLNRGVKGYGRTILALYGIDAVGSILAVAALSLEHGG